MDVSRDDDHQLIVDRIIEILRAKLRIKGIIPSDIRETSYPWLSLPDRGILVSPLDDSEAGGLNSQDDFVYTVQISRCFGNQTGTSSPSRLPWRRVVKDLFNNQRIGVEIVGGCEIVCSVRSGRIELKMDFERKGFEAGVLYVDCLVRKTRVKLED